MGKSPYKKTCRLNPNSLERGIKKRHELQGEGHDVIRTMTSIVRTSCPKSHLGPSLAIRPSKWYLTVLWFSFLKHKNRKNDRTYVLEVVTRIESVNTYKVLLTQLSFIYVFGKYVNWKVGLTFIVAFYYSFTLLNIPTKGKEWKCIEFIQWNRYFTSSVWLSSS